MECSLFLDFVGYLFFFKIEHPTEILCRRSTSVSSYGVKKIDKIYKIEENKQIIFKKL